MKRWKEKTWQHEITGVDGNTILFGVIINEQEYEFATGKFSNCVWGFYVLKF